MPPKPAPPVEDMQTRHQRGVELETKVRGLLHHREIKQAHDVFNQEWQHTLLADLPLRQSFKLERLDRRGLAKMIERSEDGKPIRLVLRKNIDPRSPKSLAVVLTGVNEVVGFLPADVQEWLAKAGEYARFYEVKPLTVSGLEAGRPELLMELVRPDLRQCSACGKLHTEDKENCKECRQKRRRKTKTLEETIEHAPVPLNNAFKHLSGEPDPDVLKG